jgi:drug/metabolite transporter (DMT)-like permease
MNTLVLLMIAILCWGIGSLFQKPASDKLDIVVIGIIESIIYVITIPFQIWLLKPNYNWNWGGAAYAAFGALLMTTGSVAYFFLLKRGGGAGEITTMTSLYPVVTVILSIAFLGEAISFRRIVAMAFALCSIYLFAK